MDRKKTQRKSKKKINRQRFKCKRKIKTNPEKEREK